MENITEQTLREYIDLCNVKWGIKVVEKKYSWFMRAIGKLLFFNKKFMDGYITTIGKKIYWPNLDEIYKNPERSFDVYFHEVQHGHDYIRFKILFILSYISPQILALPVFLALLAIPLANNWLVFLAFAVLLAPIPSYFRSLWEWRGSSCNLAMSVWRFDKVSSLQTEYLVKRFKGPDYYFMWPFTKWFRKKLAKIERRIRSGKLTEVQRETYRFLSSRAIV